MIDLEWNQAMRSDSPVFNRLPIHLRGEIIEIGAVKLNDDMTAGEEFSIYVHPKYFRKMHYKVKKLTGIDHDVLAEGVAFPVALKKLREFCGDDVTFLTWGCDDGPIMEQNIIIHDLDWDWINSWINLQLIFNVQTGGDKNQRSLADAMEYFGIEQTRVAHDALGDAYNTAKICEHLDVKEGIRTYADADRILSSRMTVLPPVPETSDGKEPILHDSFGNFESKAAAFSSEDVSSLTCPVCSSKMQPSKWLNQGDGRYMNIYSCPEHGKYLLRVKFKKGTDNRLTANRVLYEADDEQITYYRQKAAEARRRGRTRKESRRRK